jgi:hypothetical protein
MIRAHEVMAERSVVQVMAGIRLKNKDYRAWICADAANRSGALLSREVNDSKTFSINSL